MRWRVYARSWACPTSNSYAALVASPMFIASTKAVDGTHPNAAGYAEWARVIDEWAVWRSWLP